MDFPPELSISARPSLVTAHPAPALPPAHAGFLMGLLAGEGHFGGDGRQAQATLRMHTRHEGLFRWLMSNVPGGKLYGPYNHDGRRYYQWMSRGPHLAEVIVPLVIQYADLVDDHVWGRFTLMCERYGLAAAAPA